MTPEEMRIAIAKACGWKTKTSKDGKRFWCKRPEWAETKHAWWQGFGILPDYLNDLNACHEFEKGLDINEAYEYGEALAAIVRKPELEAARREGQDEDDQFPFNGWGHFAVAHLTAAQRCEAYIRTKGLLK